MTMILLTILLILITYAGGNYVGDHIPAARGFKTVRICLARGVFRASKDAIATAHMIMAIIVSIVTITVLLSLPLI